MHKLKKETKKQCKTIDKNQIERVRDLNPHLLNVDDRLLRESTSLPRK